jgi:hypothetical protein
MKEILNKRTQSLLLVVLILFPNLGIWLSLLSIIFSKILASWGFIELKDFKISTSLNYKSIKRRKNQLNLQIKLKK